VCISCTSAKYSDCRNCMVVGFKTTYIQSVPITINVVSSNPTQCEVYSIQHYAKKFVWILGWCTWYTHILLNNMLCCFFQFFFSIVLADWNNIHRIIYCSTRIHFSYSKPTILCSYYLLQTTNTGTNFIVVGGLKVRISQKD
jgi:hypothetical protein